MLDVTFPVLSDHKNSARRGLRGRGRCSVRRTQHRAERTIALVVKESNILATRLPRFRAGEIPKIRPPVAGVEALGATAADK
jgi:hypothetical protein